MFRCRVDELGRNSGANDTLSCFFRRKAEGLGISQTLTLDLNSFILVLLNKRKRLPTPLPSQ